MKTSTQTKFESIRRDLAGKRVIVAFSGGVDSTVLASVASEVASEIRLLTISSPTVPKNELADARSIAEELGLELIVEEFDWLEEERLASNNVERCFYCKEILVDLWLRTAKEIGFDIVIEGTTSTETKGYRPGAKALEASSVRSPFLNVGISKEEVREFARSKNLSVSEKPSMACLATRFPYDTKITVERLEMVESVENAVQQIFGVKCVRARYHDDLVRIEVGEDELSTMFDIEKIKKLEKKAKQVGFAYVTLDLRGYRTGAMDEGLELS